MRLKNMFTLLKKEFKSTPKSFMFIWSFILPVAISIIISLLMGSLFVSIPKLGIYAETETKILELIKERKSVKVREFESVELLKSATMDGIVDVGIVIPEGFDESLKTGEKVELISFIFGESYAKDRAIIAVTIGEVLRDMSGKKKDVSVLTELLGEKGLPWSLRLFPLVILMAIFIGGIFIPSTSLMLEKRRKTLDALKVSPVTLNEIFISKWLFGFILSLFTALMILVINNMLLVNPLPLVSLIILGAIMATFFGLLLGIYFNDITTLFSLWKSAGIIIFFPALVYLFPQIPEIIAKFFPTYYLLKPIMDISVTGRAENLSFYLIVLVIINIILYGITLLSIKKKGKFL